MRWYVTTGTGTACASSSNRICTRVFAIRRNRRLQDVLLHCGGGAEHRLEQRQLADCESGEAVQGCEHGG
jgi:hypothetical protein